MSVSEFKVHFDPSLQRVCWIRLIRNAYKITLLFNGTTQTRYTAYVVRSRIEYHNPRLECCHDDYKECDSEKCFSLPYFVKMWTKYTSTSNDCNYVKKSMIKYSSRFEMGFRVTDLLLSQVWHPFHSEECCVITTHSETLNWHRREEQSVFVPGFIFTIRMLFEYTASAFHAKLWVHIYVVYTVLQCVGIC